MWTICIAIWQEMHEQVKVSSLLWMSTDQVFFSSHLEILCIGERHIEVCKARNRCRYHLSSTICHSCLQARANKMFCSQLKKGKLHGCIDVGLSVMSVKKKAMCIDLDTEDNIYHLKVTLEAQIGFVWLQYECQRHLSLSQRCTVYKCLNTYTLSLSFVLFVQRLLTAVFSPVLLLLIWSLCYPGEGSRAVWWVGVKAASSQTVSAEWDCYVSPWKAPFPPPRHVFPVPQWLTEKSKWSHSSL